MLKGSVLRRFAIGFSLLFVSYVGSSAAADTLVLQPGQNPFQLTFTGETVFSELVPFELTVAAARFSSVVSGLSVPAFDVQTTLNNAQFFDASFAPLTGTDAFLLTAFDVPAGLYYLGVNGLTTGVGGGVIGSFDVIPVPEPAAWLMLLAGLGLVGVFVRRSRA